MTAGSERAAGSPSPLPQGEVGSRSDPGERLSLMSSALPSDVVADDGVEDGDELAHHRGEREFFRLSCAEQALIEGLENRVMAAWQRERPCREHCAPWRVRPKSCACHASFR